MYVITSCYLQNVVISFDFHVLLHVYFHFSNKVIFSQSLSVKAVRKKKKPQHYKQKKK